MKDRIPKGRLFMAAATMAAAGLACAYSDVPINPTRTEPARTPVPSPTLPFKLDSLTPDRKITPVPTGTSAPTQTETPTQVPTHTQEKPKTPELMNPWIGNIYLGKAFQIYIPKETAELAAFWGGEKTFSIDNPFLILQNELTEEEYNTMNPYNLITTPRVGLVFQTNNRREGLKHLMVYAHSGYSAFGEELPLNFFKKMINMNPENMNETKFSLVQEGNVSNLEIIHYTIVTEQIFNQSFFNYKNSTDLDWQNVPLFLDFETLGINTTKEPFNGQGDLITFIACYGPEGDLTANRMIITAKLLP